MFEKAKTMLRTGFESVKKCAKQVKDKALALFVGVGATLGATAGKAAVTVDSATGAISGSLDLTPYYSALAIVIPVTVTIIVGRIIIRTIKGA